MMRLLAGASIIAIACSLVHAEPASEQVVMPGLQESQAFHTIPAFALGQPFTGTLFSASTVLSVTPVSLLLSPELFAPIVTGSWVAPASPVTLAGTRDDSLAGRFLATTNRFAGPQDELQPSDLGIRAALNGTDPQMTVEWAPVRDELQQRLIDYAYDFGADDLTGAVADNARVLALFGWNGEIDAPVVAQGE